MTTTLKLTASNTRPRAIPISGVSPAQSRTHLNLSGLVQGYARLSMRQKGGWQHIANIINDQQNRTGRHKLTPANTYVTLNSGRLACGLSPVGEAPANISAPPLLPSIHVATTLTSGVFTLSLVTEEYGSAVLILAAAPAPAGRNTFPVNAFKPLGCLPSLTAGGIDIAAMYRAVYGVPDEGSQLALKLVAISDAGVRLSPLVVLGVVTANLPSSHDLLTLTRKPVT